MAEKLEIKVGEISFSGEGDGAWLAEQLDKVLKQLPDIAKLDPTVAAPPPPLQHGGTAHVQHGHKATGTLASFLTDKGAKTNKTRKFLAAALWVQDGGKNRLTTRDVTKALSENNQGSVGNAGQCLISNCQQGFCQKDGKQFYVTEEGRAEIG
jgi:hypothetical protein